MVTIFLLSLISSFLLTLLFLDATETTWKATTTGEEKSGDDGSQESDIDGGSGCEESRGHTQIPQILPL
jgi:hypothetical protein